MCLRYQLCIIIEFFPETNAIGELFKETCNMKFVSINELDHFEFHDTQIISIENDNGNMKFILRMLNATTKNSQNNFPTDMCIKEAEVVFECANIIEMELGSYEVFDSNKNLIESVKAQKVRPE